MLAQLQQRHPESVRLVFRQFPLLPMHDKASLAGQAAQAAGDQGAFWPMHDLLFERQGEWAMLSPEEFEEWLIQAATDLGLDAAAFRQDLTSGRYEALMQQAFEECYTSGIPGTPVLYLNGNLFRYQLSPVNLEAAVRLELLAADGFPAYPPSVLQPDTDYVARMVLDSGEVLIELYPDSAPTAVNSFVFLAQHGWYDGNPIHRVLPGVLVETGDPSGTGLGGPGYYFGTEIDPSLHFDQPGLVAMTSISPGTNGSQFFITLVPLPDLDGSRTIFGRVVEGLDLLSGLSARDPMTDLLTPPQATVLTITIETE